VARGIFGNISKTKGLLGNFGDCGLITKKPGPLCEILGIIDFWIYF
jgi:hypothetical protein